MKLNIKPIYVFKCKEITFLKSHSATGVFKLWILKSSNLGIFLLNLTWKRGLYCSLSTQSNNSHTTLKYNVLNAWVQWMQCRVAEENLMPPVGLFINWNSWTQHSCLMIWYLDYRPLLWGNLTTWYWPLCIQIQWFARPWFEFLVDPSS